MVHWSWLVLTFLVGIVGGFATCICLACCVIAKVADDEAKDTFDFYESEIR